MTQQKIENILDMENIDFMDLVHKFFRIESMMV